MSDFVPIEQLREHVKLDADDASQDSYLRLLMQAAIRSVENETGQTISGDSPTLAQPDLDVVAVAVLMLVGNWFLNRESVSVGQGGTELPLGVRYLLVPLKRWTV